MILAVALAALIGGGKDARDGEGEAPVATALPFDGRSPAMPADRSERVLVRLPRPALGELDHPPAGAAARRYVASEHAEGRALRGGLRARGVELDHVVPFGRVYPGFAATVPARDLAQLSSLGVRTDPVRRLYPAAEVVLPARVAPRTGGATGTTPVLTRTGPRPAVALLDATPALAGLLPARTAWLPEGGAETVPGRLRKETAATSDEVVQGLERAVDPNGDGDPADAVPTALLGLSSPYAGFADGPEARAAGAAATLNTLVVAPAGNEDGPAGAAGGAAAALTAGAEPAGGLPAVDTTFGPGALLGGRLPADRIALAKRGPGGRLFDARGRSLVRGKAVALPRGADPARETADAAAAGARLVLLADPASAPFPGVPPGRATLPVVGLAGEAARQALAATPGALRLGLADTPAAAPAPRPAARRCGDGAPARFSAQGAYGAAKPDLLASGLARRPEGLLAGTGVAAARVASAAAAVAAREPGLTAAARADRLRAEPPPPLTPAIPTRACDGPPVAGPLRLRHDPRGGVDGVSLVLGAFAPGRPGARPARVRPTTRVVLEVVDRGGKVVRVLTPPGGARDLLPGEYAYTLPKAAVAKLGGGLHAFRARVTAPGVHAPVVRRSPEFTAR